LTTKAMTSSLNSFEYFLRAVTIYPQLSSLCLNWVRVYLFNHVRLDWLIHLLIVMGVGLHHTGGQ
jgi:hypothetical protein